MKANIKRSFFAMKARSKFEKSVLKSTYHGDYDAPKEKHYQYIAQCSQGQDSKVSSDQALLFLESRLSDTHMVSALKALLIFHRMLEFLGIKHLSRLSGLKLLSFESSDSSERGSIHANVINNYHSYLRLRANILCQTHSVFSVRGFQRVHLIENMNDQELTKECDNVLLLLQALVKLAPSCKKASEFSSGLTKSVIYWVLLDAKDFYNTGNLIVDALMRRNKRNPVFVERTLIFGKASYCLKEFFCLVDQLKLTGICAPIIDVKDYDTEVVKIEGNPVLTQSEKENYDFLFDLNPLCVNSEIECGREPSMEIVVPCHNDIKKKSCKHHMIMGGNHDLADLGEIHEWKEVNVKCNLHTLNKNE